MKNRYHIQTFGNDDEAYNEAIAFACELASKQKDKQFEIVLLVSKKGATGWLDRIYGSDLVKRMHDGVSFSDCEASIKIISQRNFKNYYPRNDTKMIVFILGANMDKIRIVEDNFEVEKIIAIPWMENSIDDWINAHNPIELRGKKNSSIFAEIDPILKVALDSLTNYVNLTTGITHPDDNNEAKTTVLALTKYHENLNPAQIEGYLIKSYWEASDAKEFADLIRTIQNGKYFRGGRRTGLKEKYKFWKKSIE